MQISHRFLVPAILALTSFTPSAIANVLTVAPTGAQFSQIQAAVNAASEGDLILISNGTYGAFTINGKSLTVCTVAAQGATILGTTTVANLTGSQQVILSGLKGHGAVVQSSGVEDGVGLLVVNNAGSVRVESCNFYGALGWGDNTTGSGPTCCDMPQQSIGHHAGAIRNNSGGISLTACQFEGGRAANGFWTCSCGTPQMGGDGLLIQSTLVSLYDSTCMGGTGGANGDDGGRGGSACRLAAGTGFTGLFTTGTYFYGGTGGDAFDMLNGVNPGRGGNGLEFPTGTHCLLFNNVYSGGGGGLCPFGNGQTGSGIFGGGSSSSIVDTRITIVMDRLAHTGNPVGIQIFGAPGQQIELLLSRTPTFQILPSWRGTLLALPGAGSVAVPLGTIPASGSLSTQFVAPPVPTGSQSVNIFVQSYRADPILGPKLSAGRTLTVLP